MANPFEAGLNPLRAAHARLAHSMNRSAEAVDGWTREWARWQMEFCATATDEEVAEADRLFGTTALSDLRTQHSGK